MTQVQSSVYLDAAQAHLKNEHVHTVSPESLKGKLAPCDSC